MNTYHLITKINIPFINGGAIMKSKEFVRHGCFKDGGGQDIVWGNGRSRY